MKCFVVLLSGILVYWSRIHHLVVFLDKVDRGVGCGLGVQVAPRLCTQSEQLPSTSPEGM